MQWGRRVMMMERWCGKDQVVVNASHDYNAFDDSCQRTFDHQPCKSSSQYLPCLSSSDEQWLDLFLRPAPYRAVPYGRVPRPMAPNVVYAPPGQASVLHW
jgi:hypothetical protein